VPTDVTKETDAGHDSLLRYQRDRNPKNLASSVAHFEHALAMCPDPCRAAALFNLAKVKFFTYQSLSKPDDFVESISRYREALELRDSGHQDRPMTLLHLFQALLYHYGTVGDEASTVGELRKLVEELKDICPEDTHEYRAADLVLQTYERFRLRDSDDSAELERLISQLDLAAQEPPDDYFDRPIRFNNLGLALQRRFQLSCKLSHLDQAIGWLEKATLAIPNNRPDKPNYLSNLGNAILVRFQLQHAVPLTKQL